MRTLLLASLVALGLSLVTFACGDNPNLNANAPNGASLGEAGAPTAPTMPSTPSAPAAPSTPAVPGK